MITANATLRGYRLSALSRPGERTVVTICTSDYHIVAEYYVPTTDPKEAIRQIVRDEGRVVLGQVPGRMSAWDDIDHIENQWK